MLKTAKAAAGKRLIICLADIEQRPSRRAITVLAQQEAKLSQQNAAVLIVQASAIDPKTLAAWVADNKVSLPVGMVKVKGQAAAALLRRWGANGLPWLIVADEKGIVTAGGFDADHAQEQPPLKAK